MCQVYNEVGCKKNISAHLKNKGIAGEASVRELIDFHNNYSVLLQEIFTRHSTLIEEEKTALEREIEQLNMLIACKREEIERAIARRNDRLKPHFESRSEGASGSSLNWITRICRLWSISKVNC